MGFRNLRDYLRELERIGELRRVRSPVDPELEMSEIIYRVMRAKGPALLFENPVGSRYPVAANLFGSPRRILTAIGTEDLDSVGERVRALLEPPEIKGLADKLRSLPRLGELASYFPRYVKSAPCQEVVEEPDLESLPVLKCWPGDAGRFITLPLVVTRDPESGKQNVGMYRLQVYDARTTGMHWQVHKDGAAIYRKYKEAGERMEVAVALGGDPVTIYSATAPLPHGFDEFSFAGFLKRSPVDLVKCLSVGLYVPAEAEMVLEGYVDPGELRVEGPFGDHTGFYSPAEPYPVFHVNCITRRRDAIYPATVVGVPPTEDYYLGKLTERAFLPVIKMQLPEITDINLPSQGVFHNCAVVSIVKSYPGHARKVMHALWGLGQLSLTKVIIVVDSEVNVQDMDSVWWHVFSNMDPARDVVITSGPLDVLDHAPNCLGFGGKMGIDATRKLEGEGYTREWPQEIRSDPRVAELVTRRWQEYGLE